MNEGLSKCLRGFKTESDVFIIRITNRALVFEPSPTLTRTRTILPHRPWDIPFKCLWSSWWNLGAWDMVSAPEMFDSTKWRPHTVARSELWWSPPPYGNRHTIWHAVHVHGKLPRLLLHTYITSTVYLRHILSQDSKYHWYQYNYQCSVLTGIQ